MRGIGAKGAIVIGLAVVLVVGVIGGWILLRSNGNNKEPIVVGTTTTPTMLDPGGAYDAGAWAVMSNLYQSLLTFSPGQEEPVPDAAEGCEFTDHELTVYRCTLRENLTFSNGVRITPEDVKFSVDRIKAMSDRAAEEAADDSIPADEKFTYAGPASLLSTLEATRVNGQDIIFELNEPDATFPYVLAGSTGAIVDSRSYEELEPRNDGTVMGSGPYVLTAFEHNEYAELRPNPQYKGVFGVPQNSITIRYFVEEDDLLKAWENDELDVVDGKMPPSYLAGINPSNPEFRVSETIGSAIRVMAFNTDEGMPMSSKAARQAAASSLDRNAITRHVHAHTVEPLYSLIPVGFTGHGTPFYDNYRDPDPDELRTRMENAGLQVPVKFHLAYSRGAATHEEAELIKQQLEADGLFEVDVKYYDWSEEFIPGVFGAREFDAFLVGWRPDYPDPATYTDNILGPGDGLSTGFSSKAIDELISSTRQESDRGRAATDYRALHELSSDNPPIIPIWQEKRFHLSTNDITGIQYLSDNSAVWRLWELRRI
ncbi:ABC transporter substrate-binding protein [Streptomyces sodiiphilus]|uniref:ABC transporter substrate-binding protein n=1 Tax=Streptomyces sodiiphilus TaxID=226217 RepID=A0ABN2NYI4_9ACTN